MMHKRFAQILLTFTAVLSTGFAPNTNTSTDAQPNYAQGEGADCTTFTVLPGRKAPGGVFILRANIDNKCPKGMNIRIDYGYEGRDTEGNTCRGGKDDWYFAFVASGDDRDAEMPASAPCWIVDKAWITNVYINP